MSPAASKACAPFLRSRPRDNASTLACRVEASVCAERNAVAAMIVGGERRIEAVAVVAGGDGPAPPCGGCRQVLAEFAADDVPVVSEHVEGERARWTVGELLPDAFRLTP